MVELGWIDSGCNRTGVDENMKMLVAQHCNECGRDYHTSEVNGRWVKVDYVMSELILYNAGRCWLCGSRDVDKPWFDNGGFLVIEEDDEVAL